MTLINDAKGLARWHRFGVVSCALLVACADRAVTQTENGQQTQGQVMLWSDWRSRVGNTVDALSDGGKWRLSSGAEQNGSIIDAPAGFSTHKVLRVLSNGHRDGWITPYVDTLYVVPIGAARNHRWEHAFHEPALADAGQHPIQDGGAVSQSNWYMGTSNGGDNLQAGQWGLNYATGGNASWPHSMWTLGPRDDVYTPLQKGVVYRHEVQIFRVSATTFRFHVWIHDASGNLLFDDDDFHNRDGTTTIGSYVHTFQVTANMSIFLMGLNGIDRKSTRLNSSHLVISYAVFCLKTK